jgi:hypothetical protein
MSRRWIVSLPSVVLVLLVAPSAFAAAEEWQSIACIPADPLPETMFEVVQGVDDFETPARRWQSLRTKQNAQATLRHDTAEHHSGQGSLGVDYQFVGKKDYEYLQLETKLEISRPGLGLGFWVKTDGTPFQFHLRIADASGETHQLDAASVHRPGWQFIAASLAGSMISWGGDGNHRIDYPCHVASICIDRPQVGFIGHGTLWIDDVALVRPRKAPPETLSVEIQGKRFGNVYAVGETAVLRVHGPGEHIRWHVADYWQQTVAQGEGAADGTEVRFTFSRPGHFVCSLELLAGGQTRETQLFAAAVLPKGESPRSDFLGFCTHFTPHGYPLECMKLLTQYGIDQFRDEIGWGGYESPRGAYHMPAYAKDFLARSAELKMRPLLIFDYASPLYDGGGFPNSPEAIAAFAGYAGDLARQTRGTVRQFEVWNEWVGACGMKGRGGSHDGVAYGQLLKPAYAAVKQAAPDATVVGIGGEYGPKCADTIVHAVETAGLHSMDAWSIHPYRYPRSPEDSDLVGEVRRTAQRVAEAGATQKAWITEIGWPTHRASAGVEEPVQAYYAVRALALLQATGLVDRVFWYDFKDDGLKRDYNENNFGVVHHQKFNCAPKPAAVAMSVFVRMTDQAVCESSWHEGSVYAVRYRLADGKRRLVAWSTRGDASARLSGKLMVIEDLMGNALPMPGPVNLIWHFRSTPDPIGKDLPTALTLGPVPVYLTGEALELQVSQP